MCDRVLVLESGHLNYDSKIARAAASTAAIRYLQYDDADDDEDKATDEELGADI